MANVLSKDKQIAVIGALAEGSSIRAIERIVPRARKVGRPRLPKGQAKGRIVPVRFKVHDLKAMTAAARTNNQTLSEWIRSTLRAAIAK